MNNQRGRLARRSDWAHRKLIELLFFVEADGDWCDIRTSGVFGTSHQ